MSELPSSPLSPSAPWVQGLLSDSRKVVQQLLTQPSPRAGTLRNAVHAYAVEIEEASARADAEFGLALVRGSLALLDAVESRPETDQRLAALAVQYFVLDDDGDDDLASPFGFDDDVEVFNAVVTELGLPELLIE